MPTGAEVELQRASVMLETAGPSAFGAAGLAPPPIELPQVCRQMVAIGHVGAATCPLGLAAAAGHRRGKRPQRQELLMRGAGQRTLDEVLAAGEVPDAKPLSFLELPELRFPAVSAPIVANKQRGW